MPKPIFFAAYFLFAESHVRIEVFGLGQGWRRAPRGWGGGVCPGAYMHICWWAVLLAPSEALYVSMCQWRSQMTMMAMIDGLPVTMDMQCALQCLHFHSAQHNSCSKLLQNDQMQLSTTERNNYDICIHIRTNAGFQGPPHRPRSRSDCPLTGSAMPRSLAERIVEPRTRHAASALADRPVPGNHLPP